MKLCFDLVNINVNTKKIQIQVNNQINRSKKEKTFYVIHIEGLKQDI